MEQNGYKYILFDLDGTLTESAPGIITSLQYTLLQYGIEASAAEIMPFIGPPMLETLRERFGLTAEQAYEALNKHYRPHYSSSGLFHFSLYDGVVDMLDALRDAGRTIMLATSKPEPFARKVLDHAKLTPYFHGIYGSTLQGARDTKTAVIEYALQCEGVSNLSEAVMVGDRRFDVEGAHACGLPVIGVLYGYGSREELTAAGADMLADSPREVCVFAKTRGNGACICAVPTL